MRLGKFFRSYILYILLICSSGAVLELGSRVLCSQNYAVAKFKFYQMLNIERWKFLNERKEKLYLEGGRNLEQYKVFGDVYPRRRTCPTQCIQDGGFYYKPERSRPIFDRNTKKYFIKINKQGFRSESNFVKAKKVGVKRIFILGDSISFGWEIPNINDRYAEILAKKLGKHFEFYNFSFPGCSTLCISEVLNEFQTYHPDIIIYQASANDYDQTLWRVASKENSKFFDFKISILHYLSKSDLFNLVTYLLSSNKGENKYENALQELDKTYAKNLASIVHMAKKAKAKMIVLNLQRADGKYYGDHAEKVCLQSSDICKLVIRSEFPTLPSGEGNGQEDNLIWKMQHEYSIKQEILLKIFPNGFYFSDIVHPNALGHLHLSKKIFAAF